LLTEEFKLKLF